MQGNAKRVSVEVIGGEYRLAIDGIPFYVRGAGGAYRRAAQIAAHGANSLRTWSTRDAGEILDDAAAHGVMVLMGLGMTPERHGFDYSDVSAVAAQLEEVTREILTYRDHPALLAWGIGNELNLSASNPDVWNAVNDVARMIHREDPNHPATTMLAGINRSLADAIAARAPDLDFLCIQMYGDIINLVRRVDEAGYPGPYVVTEWGATGHWEVAQTRWGAPIEQTSSEKADAIVERYRTAIIGDSRRCMGSYVFLWGQKQERTPTWYGLLTEDGRETEAVDAMEYLWTGAWPEHTAPRLTDLLVDGRGRYDNVTLAPGQEVVAVIVSDDPGRAAELTHARDQTNAGVAVHAEVLPEATILGEGGDYEPRPEAVPGLIRSVGPTTVAFAAPARPGPYRLFVCLTDEHNHAATANLPFLVE